MLRIIKILEKKNLVKVVRGPKGGLLLKKPANLIFLDEVYKAVQEDTKSYKIHNTENRCVIGDNVFTVLRSLQEKLDNQLYDLLSSLTIEDLTSKTLEYADKKIESGSVYLSYKQVKNLKN